MLYEQLPNISKDEIFESKNEIDDEFTFEEDTSLLERKECTNIKMEYKRKSEEYLSADQYLIVKVLL